MARPSPRQIIYINASAEEVWNAVTDPERSAKFWGNANISTWQPGLPWAHQRPDGSGRSDLEGTVIDSTPPSRLVFTWGVPGEKRPYGPSTVHITFFGHGSLVRLALLHENFADERERDLTAEGWAVVLSNLKTYLETGRPLPEAPWRVPRS